MRISAIAGCEVSLNRYNPRRDENEPEIIEALRKEGVFVERLSGARVPDLLCCHKGLLFLVEVKMPDGRLTKAQRDFSEDIFEHNIPAYICTQAYSVPTLIKFAEIHYAQVDIKTLQLQPYSD